MEMVSKIKRTLSNPAIFIKDAMEGFRQDSSAIAVLLFGIFELLSCDENLKCCDSAGKN